MEIQHFLCDVFAVSDLAKVDELDKVFNIEKSCLDYNTLFEHPRFRSVIAFVNLFKETFGFFPAHPLVDEVLAGVHEWDMHLVSQRLIKTSFLAIVRQDNSPLYVAFEKAKFSVTQTLYSIQASPLSAKLHAWNWISRDCPLLEFNIDATLYASYSRMVLPRRLSKDVSVNSSSRTSDFLEWQDLIKSCPYEYDIDAYHITVNNNYFRNIYMHCCVYFDSDVSPSHALALTKAVASVSERERLVVCAPTPILAALRAEHTMNLSLVHPQFMPYNCAAACFVVSNNPTFELPLGSTLQRNITIASSLYDVNTAKNSVLAIADPTIAYDAVKASMPHAALPLFAPQPVLDAYFKLYIDSLSIANKTTQQAYDKVASRTTIYTSLIPSLARLSFPMKLDAKTDKKYALVMIDTRANNLSLTSLFASLSNLNSSEYDVVIGTRKTHQDFYRAHLPQAKFFWHPSFEASPFDIEAYNAFAKSPVLWTYLKDARYTKCVIVQDDGVIARPGIEAWLEGPYTYVGAPWLPCAGNEEVMQLTNKRMVGNGGVCIRDVTEMLNICLRHKQGAMTLFNNRLQQIQEDVFYAKYSKTPTLQEASNFSVEQVYNPNAMAFHKPWAYLQLQQVLELAKNIVEASKQPMKI